MKNRIHFFIFNSLILSFFCAVVRTQITNLFEINITQYYDQVNNQIHQRILTEERDKASNINIYGQSKQGLRLTMSFTSQKEEKSLKYFSKLFDVVSIFFKELIEVEANDANNVFTLKEINNCLGYDINSSFYKEGVPNSDLHLFVSYSQFSGESDSSSPIASAGLCYVDPILKRPTFGRVVLNSFHFQGEQERKNVEFENDLSIIIHEIIHVLGFSPAVFSFWVDKETNQFYGKERVKEIFKEEKSSSLLFSKNLLKTARNHFGCESLQGIKLENEGGDFSHNQHFEKSIIFPEIMTGSSSKKPILSLFTIALLVDTGFWSGVNVNMANELAWGKDKGCAFEKYVCKGDLKYAEFENRENETRCSFDGNGYGITYIHPFTDDCNVVYEMTSCNDNLSSKQVLQDKIQKNKNRQFLNKCLLSKNITDSHISPVCEQVACSSNKKEIIIFSNKFHSSIVCSEERQTVEIIENDIKISEVQCPHDFKAFCSIERDQCLNSCSQNGFCLKGICHCISGYSGQDCSKASCLNGVLDMNDCTDQCSLNKFRNPDNVCRTTCPSGYFQDKMNQTCQQCPYLCKECFNNLSCTSCSLLSYLSNSQCVYSCPNATFEFGQYCQPCPLGCEMCSNFFNCSKCHQNFNLIENACVSIFQCNYPCNNCSSDKVCTSCVSGFYLNNEQCIQKCSKKYYLSNGICLKCSESCEECSKTQDNCTKCKEGDEFLNNNCSPKCNIGQIYKYGECQESIKVEILNGIKAKVATLILISALFSI